MNAIFYKINPPVWKSSLDEICSLLYKRNIEHLESRVLDLMEDFMTREYNTLDDSNDALHEIKTLYFSFNEYYEEWLKDQNIDAQKEIKDAMRPFHANILMAHCVDPESMDDLMYEVYEHVNNLDNESQTDEAQYHLDCYKKIITA